MGCMSIALHVSDICTHGLRVACRCSAGVVLNATEADHDTVILGSQGPGQNTVRTGPRILSSAMHGPPGGRRSLPSWSCKPKASRSAELRPVHLRLGLIQHFRKRRLHGIAHADCLVIYASRHPRALCSGSMSCESSACLGILLWDEILALTSRLVSF